VLDTNAWYFYFLASIVDHTKSSCRGLLYNKKVILIIKSIITILKENSYLLVYTDQTIHEIINTSKINKQCKKLLMNFLRNNGEFTQSSIFINKIKRQILFKLLRRGYNNEIISNVFKKYAADLSIAYAAVHNKCIFLTTDGKLLYYLLLLFENYKEFIYVPIKI